MGQVFVAMDPHVCHRYATHRNPYLVFASLFFWGGGSDLPVHLPVCLPCMYAYMVVHVCIVHVCVCVCACCSRTKKTSDISVLHHFLNLPPSPAFHLNRCTGMCLCALVLLQLGVCTATIAFLIDITIDKLSEWKFSTTKVSLDNCFHNDCVSSSLLKFSGINLMFVFVAASFVTFGAAIAAGSGIPEVKCKYTITLLHYLVFGLVFGTILCHPKNMSFYLLCVVCVVCALFLSFRLP